MPGAKAEGAETGLACSGAVLPRRAVHNLVPGMWEGSPMGVLCPPICSGTMESVATLTLGAPTLSLELVLAAELAHPRVSG